MSASPIIDRVLKQQQAGEPLWDFLCRLPASDLQSLLLAVYATRCQEIGPSQVLQAYQRNKMFQPTDLSAWQYQQLEQLLRKHLPAEFDWIELAPVAPLATCSSFGAVSQDKVLSALRGAEVLADNTNVLALESAARRKEFIKKDAKDKTVVHLANTHRLLRTQPLPDPKYTPHFKIASLTSAGRDQGNYDFECDELIRHLSFHLSLLQDVLQDPQQIKGNLTFSKHMNADQRQQILQRVNDSLAVDFQEYPQREAIDAYYQSICFQINLQMDQMVNIADGGFTDWTQRLVNSRKERFLISAVGMELLLRIADL